MHDYKIYLPHHRERNSAADSPSVTVISVLLLILLMGIVVFYWFDALDVTSANQQQYYSQPVAASYQRPAAFHLGSPTAAQMDNLDHLQQIAQVRR